VPTIVGAQFTEINSLVEKQPLKPILRSCFITPGNRSRRRRYIQSEAAGADVGITPFRCYRQSAGEVQSVGKLEPPGLEVRDGDAPFDLDPLAGGDLDDLADLCPRVKTEARRLILPSRSRKPPSAVGNPPITSAART